MCFLVCFPFLTSCSAWFLPSCSVLLFHVFLSLLSLGEHIFYFTYIITFTKNLNNKGEMHQCFLSPCFHSSAYRFCLFMECDFPLPPNISLSLPKKSIPLGSRRPLNEGQNLNTITTPPKQHWAARNNARCNERKGNRSSLRNNKRIPASFSAEVK